MSRTIVRSGRTTVIVLGASYSGARLAPGESDLVSPAFGAGATGWANSAGVSPTFAAGLVKSAGSARSSGDGAGVCVGRVGEGGGRPATTGTTSAARTAADATAVGTAVGPHEGPLLGGVVGEGRPSGRRTCRRDGLEPQ